MLASAAQQGLAISFGQQPVFSASEMIAYAVTAGATAGLAKQFGVSELIGEQGVEKFVEAFSETVAINASVQLFEMGVGLERKFNLKSMVEQSVAQVLAAKISLKLQNQNFAVRAAAEELSSAVVSKTFGYQESVTTLAANYLGDAVNDANADYLGQKVKAQNQTAISDEPKLNNSNVTSLNANMNNTSMNAELNYVSQSLSEDKSALGEENSEATFYTGFHQTTQKAQNSLNQASFFAQQARSTSQSTPHSAIGALSQAVYDHQDSWWAKGVMGLAALGNSAGMHMLLHAANPNEAMDPLAGIEEMWTHRDAMSGGGISEMQAGLDFGVEASVFAGQGIADAGKYGFDKVASFFKRAWDSEVGIGAEKTLYHTVTSPNVAQSVLNGIDSDFFNASSRFGKGFYLSEVPDTTLAELVHHNAVGVDTIRYAFNAGSAKILDLTKSRIAKAWDYEGGDITPFTRELGEKAREAGFNVVRFSSERGHGANIVIFRDFDRLLRPQMIVPSPGFDPEINSNCCNDMRR